MELQRVHGHLSGNKGIILFLTLSHPLKSRRKENY